MTTVQGVAVQFSVHNLVIATLSLLVIQVQSVVVLQTTDFRLKTI